MYFIKKYVFNTVLHYIRVCIYICKHDSVFKTFQIYLQQKDSITVTFCTDYRNFPCYETAHLYFKCKNGSIFKFHTS
jgi:hypothetical protein